MTQLWNLLIPPQQQSVLLNLYTPEVLRHLATSLGSKQWRDREAACVALTTFLPTKTWSKVRPTLMQLWTSGMRVLDDIRDSTRKAAISFMKVLSNHVIFYILFIYTIMNVIGHIYLCTIFI
jgi:proteasome component ECM29